MALGEGMEERGGGLLAIPQPAFVYSEPSVLFGWLMKAIEGS